jgi:hypothetical protein
MSIQTLHHYIQALGETALKKKIYPYLFRHSRLQFLRKKLSPDAYQLFAGHSMEVALEHYSHLDNDDLRGEMFERIFNIEELSKEDKKTLAQVQEDIKNIYETIHKLKETIEVKIKKK